MINRDPDITRLARSPGETRADFALPRNQDRRMVLTRITPEGFGCFADLDEPVTEIHKKQLGHLGREGLRSLMTLLETAREKVESNFFCIISRYNDHLYTGGFTMSTVTAPATTTLEHRHRSLSCAVQGQAHDDLEREGRVHRRHWQLQYDSENVANSSVQATIDATTINTREPQRDTHLKSADFFDVEKFPTLTFKSTRVSKKGEGEALGRRRSDHSWRHPHRYF